MDITQIRRKNLQKLIKEKYKTRKEFAEHLGKSYSQVTSWFLNTKAKRDIGEKLAREIEKTLCLSTNSLDEVNDNEYEYIKALSSIGYQVTENSETFPYNELNFTPSFKVKKGQESFLVTTMSSPFFSEKLIRIVSGLNVSHFSSFPNKVIIPLCEDDLYFAQHEHGEFQKIVDKRLDLARNGSPFDTSDFLISIGEKKTEKAPSGLWDKLKQQWPTITSENKHSDAVVAAKQLLKLNEIDVFETPDSKSGRLMVMTKALWSLPSLVIYLPNKSKSFYIDIYPEKRFWIIQSLPDNKYPEILFVKQSEVIDIVPLVQKHIEKWF